VLTLYSNIFGLEFSAFYKFRELFGEWCLGGNGVGGNYLDTAEPSPVCGGLIAIQYLYISLSVRAFSFQTQLIRSVQNRLLFIYHSDSLHRAYLRAYAAALAVFQINPEGYGLADDGLGAIEPAQKTGRSIPPDGGALFLVYDRTRVAPLTRAAGFTNTRR